MKMVYVFKSSDYRLRRVQGTWCRFLAKEPEIGKGYISVEPLNNILGLDQQVVVGPGQYVKEKKKNNSHMMCFLLSKMEEYQKREVFYDLVFSFLNL